MNHIETAEQHHNSEQGATVIKIPVLTYSRVSGYYNPVVAFNKGKREEFSQRKYIDLDKVFKK